MYSIDTTKRFDKDLKRCLKRGLDLQHIYDAIALLRTTGTLPVQYRPHKLSGSKDGQWECHIETDWLMTCTVTVKSSDGKYSDTCNITVEIEESTEETKEETKDESADGSKDESADGSKDDSGSDKSSGARARKRVR